MSDFDFRCVRKTLLPPSRGVHADGYTIADAPRAGSITLGSGALAYMYDEPMKIAPLRATCGEPGNVSITANQLVCKSIQCPEVTELQKKVKALEKIVLKLWYAPKMPGYEGGHNSFMEQLQMQYMQKHSHMEQLQTQDIPESSPADGIPESNPNADIVGYLQ